MERRWVTFLLYNILVRVSLSTAITEKARVTDLVFLDIDIGKEEAGRIVIGLFGATSPKTVQNFISLAKHEYGYGYRETIFHRIIDGFMMQGGDFTKFDGTGGRSIYGTYFKDENFIHKHYGSGWVCMANAGPDTNGSQFYITFIKTPWIDGTHTCFGKVLQGMDVVRKAEKVQTDSKDRPLSSNEVVIVDSGTIPLRNPFIVSETDAEDIDLTDLHDEEYDDDDEEEFEEVEEGVEEGIDGPLTDDEQMEDEELKHEQHRDL